MHKEIAIQTTLPLDIINKKSEVEEVIKNIMIKAFPNSVAFLYSIILVEAL